MVHDKVLIFRVYFECYASNEIVFFYAVYPYGTVSKSSPFKSDLMAIRFLYILFEKKMSTNFSS